MAQSIKNQLSHIISGPHAPVNAKPDERVMMSKIVFDTLKMS